MRYIITLQDTKPNEWTIWNNGFQIHGTLRYYPKRKSIERYHVSIDHNMLKYEGDFISKQHALDYLTKQVNYDNE